MGQRHNPSSSGRIGKDRTKTSSVIQVDYLGVEKATTIADDIKEEIERTGNFSDLSIDPDGRLHFRIADYPHADFTATPMVQKSEPHYFVLSLVLTINRNEYRTEPDHNNEQEDFTPEAVVNFPEKINIELLKDDDLSVTQGIEVPTPEGNSKIAIVTTLLSGNSPDSLLLKEGILEKYLSIITVAATETNSELL